MTNKKMTWRDAEAKLEELRGNLMGTAQGFQHSVKIVHGDGSVMFFENAFCREWNDYVFVFTEHNGYHWYHIDDANVYEYAVVDRVSLTDEELAEWKDDADLYRKSPDEWWKRHEERRD